MYKPLPDLPGAPGGVCTLPVESVNTFAFTALVALKLAAEAEFVAAKLAADAALT